MFEADNKNILKLTQVYGLNRNELEAGIGLLKSNDSIPKGCQNKCLDRIEWLTKDKRRETLFINVYQALKAFITIPVTSSAYERSFSKLLKKNQFIISILITL